MASCYWKQETSSPASSPWAVPDSRPHSHTPQEVSEGERLPGSGFDPHRLAVELPSSSPVHEPPGTLSKTMKWGTGEKGNSSSLHQWQREERQKQKQPLLPDKLIFLNSSFTCHQCVCNVWWQGEEMNRKGLSDRINSEQLVKQQESDLN